MSKIPNRQLSIPGARLDEHLDVERRGYELAQRAVETVRKAKSENTRAVYKRHGERWVEWCARWRTEPYPVHPESLVLHLQELAEAGYARSTLEVVVSAISFFDARARATPADPRPDTARCHPLVRSWMKGFGKTSARKIKQAPICTPEQWRRVLMAMYEPGLSDYRTLLRVRDRALLLVGYYGACRRAELSKFFVRDIQVVNGTLELFFRGTKGDQKALGETRVVMAQGESLQCPVSAWSEWLEVLRRSGRADDDHPAFVPVLGSGQVGSVHLCERRVCGVVTERADAAGVHLTAHSLRALFATHAREAGHSEDEIQHHGRWLSRPSFLRYVRRSREWVHNPTAGLALIGRPPSMVGKGEP